MVQIIGKKAPPVVKVCIPFYGHLPQSAVILNEQIVLYGIPGYNVHVFKQPSTIIEFARNDLAYEPKDFKYDFLFFIDADVGFEPNMMERMVPVGPGLDLPVMVAYMKQILDHDVHICAGPYVGRFPPHEPLVYEQVGEETYQIILDPPDHGVHEVAGVATGFLCIKRQVLDDFLRRNNDIERKTKTGKESWAFLKDKLTELLQSHDDWNLIRNHFNHVKRMLDVLRPGVLPPFWVDYIYDPVEKKYHKRGEDIYFCHHARKMGYRVYVDFDCAVGHESFYYPTVEKYKAAFMADCIADFKEAADERGLKYDDKGNPIGAINHG